MPHTTSHPFPRDNDGLTDLHYEIAGALQHGLRQIGEVFALTFGEEPTHGTLRSLAVDACHHGSIRQELRALFDRMGWRAYLDEKGSDCIDTVELTQIWRDAVEYAGQGIAPHEHRNRPVSIEDRKRRVEALIAHSTTMLESGAMLFGNGYLDIWKGVAARAAIDFGGAVTIEGLRLLSGVPLGAVRNAVNMGELHPDEAGNIPAENAKAWLERRREFCPSRWINPKDGQDAFDESKVTEADENGMILVPQDADGTPFTPEHVVRTAKSAPGLSITIGAKGSEEQHCDFYEVLTALAKMDVARWRRRNSAGNWGIVRARGAWIAVSKAEIDRQLAAKSAEAA